MKGSIVVTLAVLGTILIGVSGISQAGGWMHKSGGEMKSMEKAPETKAPEFSEWEYLEAVETGTLPGSGQIAPRSSTGFDVPPIRWAEPGPNPPIGGLEFRTVDLGS